MVGMSSPEQEGPPGGTQPTHLPMRCGFEASWRKVASTHSLQDLMEDDSGIDHDAGKSTFWFGVGLVAAGIIFGAVMLTWLAAPLFDGDELESWGLAWMQEYRFHCLLIPVTVPITLVAVFLNWLSLKLFKHNS